MDIRSYLDRERLTPPEFAGRIDVTVPALYRYMAGRVPRAEVMQKIIEVTQGAVMPNDFFASPASVSAGEVAAAE